MGIALNAMPINGYYVERNAHKWVIRKTQCPEMGIASLNQFNAFCLLNFFLNFNVQ